MKTFHIIIIDVNNIASGPLLGLLASWLRTACWHPQSGGDRLVVQSQIWGLSKGKQFKLKLVPWTRAVLQVRTSISLSSSPRTSVMRHSESLNPQLSGLQKLQWLDSKENESAWEGDGRPGGGKELVFLTSHLKFWTIRRRTQELQ